MFRTANRWCLAWLVFACATGVHAQLSMGGIPLAWSLELADTGIPWHTTEPDAVPETGQFLASEEASRFGVQVPFAIDVVEQGWNTTLPDGSTLYRVGVNSPGAVVMSLQFSAWELPEGARVFIHDMRRTKHIGALDNSNRSPLGDMATAILPGDSLVVEYHVPAGSGTGQLRVASLTHGIRDPFAMAFASDSRDLDPGYQSAPCHINIICPEAAAWQREKRAVALFLRPDGNGCTGTLINNTAQPGRPLFYFANHCFQPNTSQWVFYFNYEAPGCVGSVGPTSQTLTGATFRAADYYADFTIVELNTAPPASFQPYYAGWDRSGAVPQTATVIHHPLYDVKKFTRDNQAATTYLDEFGTALWRNYWDVGLIEAVSSGSVLWDQNKRIVGHLTDGAQDCTNATTLSSGSTKFAAGWDGPNPDARKRDWLDPTNTVSVLDGFEPFAVSAVQVRPRMFLDGPYDPNLDRMVDALRSAGLLPLNEPYSAMGYTHVGGGGESTTAPVLATTGVNAIVDWVVLELRSATTPSQVLATRSALLQRDGDVVDADGTSAVSFPVAAGNYHVAVRHRNHLGIMSASPVAIAAAAVTVDLSNGSIALFGGAAATKLVGARRLLCAGDVNGDGRISYVGASNDRDPVLQVIGGVLPTNSISAYLPEDVNMDGIVRYTGADNDRDIILQNIGGVVPTNIRSASLP